jgi:hypothetical protein
MHPWQCLISFSFFSSNHFLLKALLSFSGITSGTIVNFWRNILDTLINELLFSKWPLMSCREKKDEDDNKGISS